MKKHFLIFLFFSASFSLIAQPDIAGKWKCDITFPDNSIGPFTVYMNFTTDSDTAFHANSSKNADRRMFGFTKSVLGRLFNKSPKKGILIRIIDGNIQRGNERDSLTGKMLIPMVGKLDFYAIIENDSLKGVMSDSSQQVATIGGVKVNIDDKMNFKPLYKKMIDTTEAHIFNPEMLQTKRWRKFERKLKKLSRKAVDDVEFFFGFNMLSPQLPFSHFNFFILSGNPEQMLESTGKYLSLEEKSKETVYMNIKSFGGSAKEIDSIFNVILSKKYKNLIIDLRENAGGGLNSAIPFAEYLTDTVLDAGVFLTQPWFKKYGEFSVESCSNIPVTRSITTKAFIDEIKTSEGRRLMINPGNITYKGNIFVLTSNTTASTCEPIVYALKNYGVATIVGERTAGAMLSAAIFIVEGKYKLFLPVADFYTFDGKRLDQAGVEPDISVEPDQALNYVLENLIY